MTLLFLRKDEAIELHAAAIQKFGGTLGLRDEGALESALAAAENRAYYENAGIAICAATYAYHLSQAHAFLDGNKRIAAAIAEVFIEINRARLRATNDEIVELVLSVAAASLSREMVEAWFEPRVILLNLGVTQLN